MRTTPIPNPLPGPSPRIRSWRVSRASHNAPRPPKPHNLSHEPLLQDTSRMFQFPVCTNRLRLILCCELEKAHTMSDLAAERGASEERCQGLIHSVSGVLRVDA